MTKSRFCNTVIDMANILNTGIVEIFELQGHPEPTHAYAWSHETDGNQKAKKHVTALRIPPVVSPETAVRSAIIQEFRLGTAEEA